MASITLYKNGDSTSSIYLELTYTLTSSTLTVQSIKGYRTSGSELRDTTTNRYHTITYPGGSGTIVSYWTGSSGSGNGCGANTTGYDWNLNGGQSFSTSGGTGTISIKTATLAVDSVLSDSTFTSIDEITVPSAALHNPVSSVSFDKANYGINDKITISWTAAPSGSATPDRYDVYLFRNNVYDDYTQVATYLSNSTFSYTFPNTPAEKGWSIGNGCTVLVRSVIGSSVQDKYVGYAYTDNPPYIIDKPTVSDVTVADITSTSANVSFTADANGGNISSLGIYLYNSNQEQIDNIGDSYSGTFNNLSPDTTYYVKAGAINEAGSGVSPNYVEFTTAPLQNATFTLTQTALSANSVSYSIVIDNINDATVTRSPSLVLTDYDGDSMTATGWDVTFNGLIPNSTYDLAVTVYTDIAPIHEYVSFTTLESTLPIHISLNGQEFANCSNIQISVKGSEFKPLTAEAIKAMKS